MRIWVWICLRCCIDLHFLRRDMHDILVVREEVDKWSGFGRIWREANLNN